MTNRISLKRNSSLFIFVLGLILIIRAVSITLGDPENNRWIDEFYWRVGHLFLVFGLLGLIIFVKQRFVRAILVDFAVIGWISLAMMVGGTFTINKFLFVLVIVSLLILSPWCFYYYRSIKNKK